MNRTTVQGTLDSVSPGRFFVEVRQDRYHVRVDVRLLGPEGLFVKRFCTKEVVGSTGPGAASAIACLRVKGNIEEEAIHAEMCMMNLADFVRQGDWTTSQRC